MKGLLVHVLERGLSKFLSYERLVEISSKLNFPLAPPLIASISVTLRCNSKCSYCPIWKLSYDYPDVSLDKLDEVFNSLRKMGVRVVTFTGGEPLIRHDLEEIISLAKHYDLMVEVCTNGILLTKKRALKLVEAGVDSITLSLDTLDPETYERHRGVPFKFAQQALASLLYIVKEYPATQGCVTCVITRHNISNIVPFVNWIYRHGKGKILVNLQPYHCPPPYSEISQGDTQKLQRLANELQAYYENAPPENEIIPDPESRPIFEKQVQELIQLKESKPDFPLNNSGFYLKSMPDFLFEKKLPDGFNCKAGYSGIVIRGDLKVSPCWRLPPVGDLGKENLTNIWFSQRYKTQRRAMKHLKCPGCMLLCHMESGWYEWYNAIYKRR